MLADRRAQRTAGANRAAGIDDRDAARADHEAEVRDVVVPRHIERELPAEVHEHTRRDLADECALRGCCGCRSGWSHSTACQKKADRDEKPPGTPRGYRDVYLRNTHWD